MFQILLDQGEVARKTINSRLPLPVGEVSRPALPLATEVHLDDVGGGQSRAGGQVNRRREPPHVGWDIWITGTETDQEIRCIAIQPSRERPRWHHNAYHARLSHDLVRDISIAQIRDVGLRKSQGGYCAVPWLAR